MLTGEHEIFYKQIRIGKNGKQFEIIKFATMLKNSPELGAKGFTEFNDSRFLPMGSIFRKTKINELPQLINIIRGDMSLVGFRPLTRESFNKILEISNIKNYSEMPGVTSLASIFLRNEEEILMKVKNKEDYYYKNILPLKASLDEWWVKNINLYNYFCILFLTALVLVLPFHKLPLKILRDLPAIKTLE